MGGLGQHCGYHMRIIIRDKLVEVPQFTINIFQSVVPFDSFPNLPAHRTNIHAHSPFRLIHGIEIVSLHQFVFIVRLVSRALWISVSSEIENIRHDAQERQSQHVHQGVNALEVRNMVSIWICGSYRT